MIIPSSPVDGLNLIWFSDLVVSGGGTMNREAAALGVPVYSVFRGKIGAVDRYLAEHGRMTLLANIGDVRSKIRVSRWKRPAQPQGGNRLALSYIVESIMSVLEPETQFGYSESQPPVNVEAEITTPRPSVLQS